MSCGAEGAPPVAFTGGSWLGPMRKGLKRYYRLSHLHFLTFSCHRLPSLSVPFEHYNSIRNTTSTFRSFLFSFRMIDAELKRVLASLEM
jgi:hypothetical protein